LSRQAIFDAIELNGVKAEWNQQAFEWGRRAAHNLDAVLELIGGGAEERSRQSLDDFVEGRATDLVAYQGEAYARRYRDLVARVREVEASRAPGQSALGEAVARYAYKLMAYKDEYEVARLHSDPAFRRKLDEQFEGDFKLQFNLSPPAIAPQDKVTGLPRKMTFGSWMMPVFGLLARLKFLRGTAFDPFGRTDERKMERQLIADYENTVAELLETLTEDNHDLAVKIASRFAAMVTSRKTISKKRGPAKQTC
jgi:indolepyruvate ferredoxin oxidoreductase